MELLYFVPAKIYDSVWKATVASTLFNHTIINLWSVKTAKKLKMIQASYDNGLTNQKQCWPTKKTIDEERQEEVCPQLFFLS